MPRCPTIRLHALAYELRVLGEPQHSRPREGHSTPEPDEPYPVAVRARRIDDRGAATAVLDCHPELPGDVDHVLVHDRSPLPGRCRGFALARMRITIPRWRAQRAETGSDGGEAGSPPLRRAVVRGGSCGGSGGMDRSHVRYRFRRQRRTWTRAGAARADGKGVARVTAGSSPIWVTPSSVR